MHYHHQQSLKDILGEVSSSLNWNNKLHETKIKLLWSEKMGTTINQHTSKIRLRRDKLFIYINSASLKHELSFQKEKIREFFNQEFGDEVVKEVKIL